MIRNSRSRKSVEFSVKKLSIANLYLNGDYTAKFTNEMKNKLKFKILKNGNWTSKSAEIIVSHFVHWSAFTSPVQAV